MKRLYYVNLLIYSTLTCRAKMKMATAMLMEAATFLPESGSPIGHKVNLCVLKVHGVEALLNIISHSLSLICKRVRK